jgi:hypothetical protein
MQTPLLLIQLPVPQLVPQEVTGNLPLAAAALRMHALHGGVERPRLPVILPPAIANRCGDAALVERILVMAPATVGFTTTVWNVERSLHLAGEIKRRRPDMMVLLGGPEVAADSFFVNEPGAAFDYAVPGEGESALLALLQGTNPADLDGLLLPGGGRTAGALRCQPLQTLDSIHDAFIAGVVTPEPDGVMFAEFYRGCKHCCSFCHYHQGRLRGTPAVRSYNCIGELFDWAHHHGVAELYILDPSLEQRRDFEQFLDYLASINQPTIPIFCELRPDRIAPRLVEKLWLAGVRSVEIGLQTLTVEACAAVGRRNDVAAFLAGVSAMRDRGIRINTDVMIGLPQDTAAGFEYTLDFLRQHGLGGQTQVFRTQVLPGTRLRSQAAALGISFDPRPPYFVLSTPHWSADELEESLPLAENELGISLAPEERPLFAGGLWRQHGAGEFSFGPGQPVFFYGWDLTTDAVRQALAATRFEDAANAVLLHVVTREPLRDQALVAEATERFLSVNPFASLTVALEVPPHAPLDIFDRLERAFERIPLASAYGRQMYSSAATGRPDRRLLAVLADDVRRQPDQGWLGAVAEMCEIVRRVECLDIGTAVQCATDDQAGIDYLFLDLQAELAESRWQAFFTALATHAVNPQQILLPAPVLHWAWLRYLDAAIRAQV